MIFRTARQSRSSCNTTITPTCYLIARSPRSARGDMFNHGNDACHDTAIEPVRGVQVDWGLLGTEPSAPDFRLEWHFLGMLPWIPFIYARASRLSSRNEANRTSGRCTLPSFKVLAESEGIVRSWDDLRNSKHDALEDSAQNHDKI